jgi:hypothetical protein
MLHILFCYGHSQLIYSTRLELFQHITYVFPECVAEVQISSSETQKRIEIIRSSNIILFVSFSNKSVVRSLRMIFLTRR